MSNPSMRYLSVALNSFYISSFVNVMTNAYKAWHDENYHFHNHMAQSVVNCAAMSIGWPFYTYIVAKKLLLADEYYPEHENPRLFILRHNLLWAGRENAREDDVPPFIENYEDFSDGKFNDWLNKSK